MTWYWHQQQHHQQHSRSYNQRSASFYNQQTSGADSIPAHDQVNRSVYIDCVIVDVNISDNFMGKVKLLNTSWNNINVAMVDAGLMGT